jgi:hypothetical protein
MHPMCVKSKNICIHLKLKTTYNLKLSKCSLRIETFVVVDFFFQL